MGRKKKKRSAKIASGKVIIIMAFMSLCDANEKMDIASLLGTEWVIFSTYDRS